MPSTAFFRLLFLLVFRLLTAHEGKICTISQLFVVFLRRPKFFICRSFRVFFNNKKINLPICILARSPTQLAPLPSRRKEGEGRRAEAGQAGAAGEGVRAAGPDGERHAAVHVHHPGAEQVEGRGQGPSSRKVAGLAGGGEDEGAQKSAFHP